MEQWGDPRQAPEALAAGAQLGVVGGVLALLVGMVVAGAAAVVGTVIEKSIVLQAPSAVEGAGVGVAPPAGAAGQMEPAPPGPMGSRPELPMSLTPNQLVLGMGSAIGEQPDAHLAELYDESESVIDEVCAGLPADDGRDVLLYDRHLLDEEDLADAGYDRSFAELALWGRGQRLVALFGDAPADRALFDSFEVTGGVARQASGELGRVEVAVLHFESAASACRFGTFDELAAPGEGAVVVPELPGGWFSEDVTIRHLHFRVADRVYLFVSERTVPSDELLALARLQVQAAEEV